MLRRMLFCTILMLSVIAAAAGCDSVLLSPSCNFDLVATQKAFLATGGQGTATVTPKVGRFSCRWSAVAKGEGLALSGKTSGTTKSSFTFTVAPNPAPAARKLSLELTWIELGGGGGTLTIPISQTGNALLSVNPLSAAAAPGGESGLALAVTANAPWTATSNQSFVTIVSGASGSGNGTVIYNVAANSGPPRSGTITVTGTGLTATLTINQPAAPVISLNATAVQVGFGGQSALTVGVTANVAWTATSNQPFVTISSGASGSGNGTIVYNVAPNSGPIRTATISVTGSGQTGTLTVTQAASPPGPGPSPSIALGSTTVQVVFSGQSALTTSVTANVAWTATSNQPFVIITSGTSGSGNGTIAYDVAANTGPIRTATITVTGSGQTAPLTVNQAAVPPPPAPSIALNPTTASVGFAGQQGLTTAVTANVAWTATSNQSFVTITSAASAPGNGTITYNVAANSGAARTATITVTGSGQTATLTVNQAAAPPPAPSIALNPTTASVGFAGQQGLTTAVTANVAWTATSNQSFVTITGGASATGNGTITYDVAANNGAARTATITVTGSGQTATLTVNQAAAPPPAPAIAIDPTTQEVAPAGPAGLTAAVTANVGWTAVSDQPWLIVTAGASGSGNGAITYTVVANDSDVRRIGHITVSGGGVTAVLTIGQDPAKFAAEGRAPLADELVAHAVHREDVLRVAGVGLDFLPQPGDVYVDRARRRHRVVAPDFVEQFVAGQRRLAMLDEVLEQQELAR